MMEKLKPIILRLTGLDVEEVLEALKYETSLEPQEKNLVFNYLFPRSIGDYELPKLIYENRGANQVGSLEKDIKELRLLVEAYRCQQYSKFIKHLLYSYTDPEKIFPVKGDGTSECCICNKTTFEYDNWENICKAHPDNPEAQRKEYLAFRSTDTDLTICLDCLVQLNYLNEFLDIIEPDRYKPIGLR